jgi:hypothetical protein
MRFLFLKQVEEAAEEDADPGNDGLEPADSKVGASVAERHLFVEHTRLTEVMRRRQD